MKVSLSGVTAEWQAANLTVLKPPIDYTAVCGPQCPGSYYDPREPVLALCCSNSVSRPALVAPQMGRMDSGNPAAFVAEPYSFTVVQFTKKKSESS